MDRTPVVLVRVNWRAACHDFDGESRRLSVVLPNVGVLHPDAILVHGGQRSGVVLQRHGGDPAVPGVGDRGVDWGRELWEMLLMGLRNHRFL